LAVGLPAGRFLFLNNFSGWLFSFLYVLFNKAIFASVAPGQRRTSSIVLLWFGFASFSLLVSQKLIFFLSPWFRNARFRKCLQ